MKLQLDKIGTIGLFVTAIASPCCFPFFGFVLTALGIGSFDMFGGWTMYVFQGLVLISLIGLYISYRKHRADWPLLLAIPSAVLITVSYYFINGDYWTTLLYIGCLGI